MIYWQDVKYIFDSEPSSILANGAEYERVAKLVSGRVLPEVASLAGKMEWVGDSRQGFDEKLKEGQDLLQQISAPLAKAGGALNTYAPKVREAKEKVVQGRAKMDALRGLLGSQFSGDSLRDWERTAPSLMVMAKSPNAAQRIPAQNTLNKGNQLVSEIQKLFSEAKGIEEPARGACVPELREAYRLLPDYRVDPGTSAAVVKSTPDLDKETKQAAANPDVRLPEAGAIPDYLDSTKIDGAVSPVLQDVRDKANAIPHGVTPRGALDDIRKVDQERFIADNKDVIAAAAEQYGVPKDLVAGIVYREAGGKPGWMDTVPYNLREWADGTGLGKPPDETSFGPAMDMQIRRAAETLGYDPGALTQPQRAEIVTSLQDVRQNIFIGAKFLADIKQQTDFAFIPSAAMTDGQMGEIAARWNAGPNWVSLGGGYARGFLDTLPAARRAVR